MLEFLYYIFIFIIGLSFGSFLNAWIYRTRENIRISNDRSFCPVCHHNLHWYDNIPLFSYFILLHGKCRYCKNQISGFYPLVEFITAGIFVLVVAIYPNSYLIIFSPELIRDLIVAYLLIFIFIYDLRYQEILDRVTVIPAVLLFAFSLSMGWFSWQDMALGAVIGGGFFWAQYMLSGGKWIGGGDVRMGVFMGIILGWQNVIFALLLAYVIGAIVSLFLLAFKKSNIKSEVPFGTFLALATFVAMFWGGQIVNWYLGLLS